MRQSSPRRHSRIQSSPYLNVANRNISEVIDSSAPIADTAYTPDVSHKQMPSSRQAAVIISHDRKFFA
ncbi:MAG: hypothetical protein ABIR91_04085 [Candidatus Saccharimonadales bacterium]